MADTPGSATAAKEEVIEDVSIECVQAYEPLTDASSETGQVSVEMDGGVGNDMDILVGEIKLESVIPRLLEDPLGGSQFCPVRPNDETCEGPVEGEQASTSGESGRRNNIKLKDVGEHLGGNVSSTSAPSGDSLPIKISRENSVAPSGRRRVRKRTKSFSSDVCNYKSTRSCTVRRHRLVHQEERPFSCDICGYNCKEARRLKQHMIVHWDEKPLTCDMCGYKCKRLVQLNRHVESHTSELPYSCDTCGYKSSTAEKLRIHTMLHNGPYSCDVCDFETATVDGVINHLRVHSGEKLLSCDMCYFKALNADHLKNHMKIHARSVQWYRCSICNYKTFTADDLRSHVITHHPKTIPYSCCVCLYETCHADHLKSHMKTHAAVN